MPGNDNRRETGATKYPARTDADAAGQFSQGAAANKRPAGGMGNSRPVDEVDEETRQSDGRNQPKPDPAGQKTSGADPAISAHSKDPSPKPGRQPAVKE